MNIRKYRIFVGDFESTVYKGQVNTEVWASASVELFTEEVNIFHSIEEQFNYFVSLNCNVICYYHNLKFDGNFWLSYFLVDKQFKQACEFDGENTETHRFYTVKEMKNKTFTYSISNMGQWYRIVVKINDHIIEFRDSLKLLPFSIKKIGDSFKTAHKKLDMEYTGFRYAGCQITEEEKKYISNDVLVAKEALEIMYTEGHKKLTIGSCCLAEFRNLIGYKAYKYYFPNVYEYAIDKELFGYTTAGEWIKQAYRGGWCYLAKGKENKIFNNGTTADVNSLYPSMMSSESGNIYPIGDPTFWKGNYIPEEAKEFNRYYFVRIKTRFYLKKNKLPFIQIKSSLLYRSTEMLETSDIYNYEDGKYYSYHRDFNGNVVPANVILTLTMTDFELIKEHYDLVDFEILDGCYFDATIGIFDCYIDKYKKMKLESSGAIRELAKLFLNNLYGKMASSTNSSYKVAYVKEDKTIGFFTVVANDKLPGYIPVGAAITSYARNFTIRAAQKNYYGKNKPGFIYADTDSIHCDLTPDKLKGIKVHDKNFCCWKLESQWDAGFFVRQKTYIEHITNENLIPVDHPYYSVKCAGMPDKCKKLFIYSMEKTMEKDIEDLTEDEKTFIEKSTEEEKDFMRTHRNITDFKIGLVVPGKLLPKRIRGGVLLTDTTYEMR